ncbi:DUF559 domain-containing protein [Ammoniphilus resinae]|nr:DUF559 domain-containing protein [Ammoniphilus resinae]
MVYGIGSVVMLLVSILLFNRREYSKTPQFLNCTRPCQRQLFRALWRAGYYPEVGYKVGKYQVDIAFPYRKVAIECTWNHEDYTDIQYYRSERKRRVLQEQGWKVVFFTPREILRNPKGCVTQIEQSFFVREASYSPKKLK